MATDLERLIDEEQGYHLCPIYENVAEERAGAIFLLRRGLARGELCVYVAAEPSAEEALRGLGATGVDVAQERARGALRLLTERDPFLRSGEFDPQAMVDFVQRAEAEAFAAGFPGSMVIVEKTWVMGPEVSRSRLVEYEVSLPQDLPDRRILLVCQYNRECFGPAIIQDVLQTHPRVILGDQVCPNPFYEPPELLLGLGSPPESELTARRVEWRIRQIKEARAAAQERERMSERLQALSRRLVEVQEAERGYLARELHDEIGQLLTGLHLMLNPNHDWTLAVARPRVEQARGIVAELLERVRGLSFDLRPSALDLLGLLPALLALFERFAEQTKIVVDFGHHGVETRLQPEVETTAYRIVQEALTNVARHAGVTSATVRVWATPDMLNLQIEDQGRGFDPYIALATPLSSGLAGMYERVKLLDGHLTIESRPQAGTQITAALPLRSSSPNGER